MSFFDDPIQLDKRGRLKHFLSFEQLNKQHLTELLGIAESFLMPDGLSVKKVPLLRGKTVVNLFFENSTRTRSTFELSAKKLSADLLNFNASVSATKKGESLCDTVKTIEAMDADMFVVRHQNSGAAHFIAKQVKEGVAVINAGDGRHAHPTQAMLDVFAIQKHKSTDFSGLKIAIVGDIKHSRVAHSDIHAFNIMGAHEVRVIAPLTLLPGDVEKLGVKVFHSLKEGLAGVDVIVMLRLQKERMLGGLLPSENEFYQTYGLTRETIRYAKSDAIVLAPGPINRGVEIESEIADGPQAVILQQVSYGIAIRMAVMSLVVGNQQQELAEQ